MTPPSRSSAAARLTARWRSSRVPTTASKSGSDDCANEADGLGGGGLAIAPDGNNVYVTGDDDVAEFARAATHTLTVALAGSGTGAVGDQTGDDHLPDNLLERVRHRQPGHAHRDARIGLDVQRLERRVFGNRPLPGRR